ncbi:MAG: MetQ/NlpA family ABC transporter substrate-binding protein [Eggerthellaceae bacterium]|nr:MetQ/NlpA family ABC transporter substrate-binding protein [Eggerthellaceae bacterium]
MQAIKKNRKLAAIVVAALGVVLAFGLAACGGSSASSSAASSASSASAASSAASEDNVIKVGASPTPHAVILNEAVAPLVEKAGYKLEVVEFTDYVLPNTATEDGEIDANYFQHIPYLNDFNAEQGTHLVNVAGVHIEPMSIYAGKTASLEELADGATVAVPNDTTNEARALLLLQTAGLIELNDPTDLAATPKDIKTNPKNLQFKEVEAATVPTILPDVDIAIINTNYAIGADLSKDLVLLTESADSPYVNVLVVKEGNEDSEKTKVLVEAITSQEVKDYISANFGDIVAV